MGGGVGCGYTCVKIIFCIFNTIVLLGGLALAILGGIYRWGSDVLKADAEKAFEGIEAGGYKVHEVLSSLSLAMFCAGLVLFFIALFGLLGVCCKWRWLLIVYAILLILIIILEIVPAIIFLIVEDSFKKAFNVGMKKNIEEANDGNSDFQSSIEYVMKQYECCTVDGARLSDFKPTEKCMLNSNFYRTECYDAIKDKLSQNTVALAAVAITIIVVELLCVVFAICLFRVQRKEMVV